MLVCVLTHWGDALQLSALCYIRNSLELVFMCDMPLLSKSFLSGLKDVRHCDISSWKCKV